MKKILVLFMVFIPVFSFAQTAVTLDRALNQTAQHLNGRLTPNSKVVILNFTSNWSDLSDYIIEELIANLVNSGTLTVVDRTNLETIRREMNFQLSGDVSDETAQSIGRMLGAQIIISGGITPIGDAYRLRVRAISVETAQILGVYNLDVAHDSRMAALTGTASTRPIISTHDNRSSTNTTTTSRPDLPVNVDIVIQTARAALNSTIGFLTPVGTNPRNGTRLHLWDISGNELNRTHRLFRLQYLGDGWYTISNNSYGVLDVTGGRNSNGVALQLWEVNNTISQRFRFRRVNEGIYEMYTNWGRTINIQSDNANNNNNIHTWEVINGNIDAQWRIYTVSGGRLTHWLGRE